MQKTKHIEIRDSKLFSRIIGEGFPIFVLHGGPGFDHQALGNYFDELSKDYMLIFLDLRGQGQSEKVDLESLTVNNMAQDIIDIAKALKLNDYGIIGHSFGAFVALTHAVNFPNKARFIIPVSASTSGVRAQQDFFNNLQTIPEELTNVLTTAQEIMQNSTSKEEFLKGWNLNTTVYFKFPTDQKKLQEFNEQTKNVLLDLNIANYCGQRGSGYYDISRTMHQIEIPVLIIAGEHDLICTLKAQKEIHNAIKTSSISIFDTGHMVFAEDNKRFIEVIQSFINKVI